MGEFSVRIDAIPEVHDSIVVKVSGPANICNVSSLLLQLLAAFEQSEDVTIDLSGVTEIDVAGLQLFCSSHRSSIFSNKGFHITGQDQPAIWEAARASGQLRTSGCAIDTEHTCIWTRGGGA